VFISVGFCILVPKWKSKSLSKLSLKWFDEQRNRLQISSALQGGYILLFANMLLEEVVSLGPQRSE
jgi:hypothetical protein